MIKPGHTKSVITVVAALWALFSPAGGARAQEDKGYANPQYLASTQWLEENIDAPTLRIVDLRPVKDYRAGHIRNAVHLEISRLRTTVDGVPGMMVGPAALEEVLSGKGIGNENPVVAYDNFGGLLAARLFMTLRHYGHNAVKLLDGGIRKWVAEGRPLTTEVPSVSPADFKAGYPAGEVVDAQWVLKNLDNPNIMLVDTRSPEEYQGQDVRARRGGHIPGAVNINWINSLSEADTAHFLPAVRLQEMFDRAGVTRDKAVVTYCQSGMRASHTYFTLLLLGYPSVKVYDGSWLEWGNREDLPLE